VTGFTDLVTRGSTSDRLRRESGKGLANFATSFGEYTSLLEAPGGTIVAQGAYESHNTVDASILGSGGMPRLAASLFAERFATDGFRDTNDDVTAYEINGLFKYALDPQSSLSFAAVYSQVKTGDVFLDTNAFVENDPDLRVRQELVNFHLGYHRQFAPWSHLLALAQGGFSPARVNDRAEVMVSVDFCPPCPAFLDVVNEIRSRPYFFDFQLQQQQRLGNHRLLVGGGFLRIQDSITVEDFFLGTGKIFGLPSPPFTDPADLTVDPQSFKDEARLQRSFASLYIQDIWEITPKWHLTAALHYDYAEDTRGARGLA
jgi:outer membrane receptor for ferrienterochelin and colicin